MTNAIAASIHPVRKSCSNPVHSWYISFSPNSITKAFFVTSASALLMCATWWGCFMTSVVFLSALTSPIPPGLSALQGHLSPDSMDEQHSEKLWLYSSTNLPRSAPSSVSKAQLLDGHIEFKTDNGKICNCALHCRPIYWTVCALFSQTLRRLLQIVSSAEKSFFFIYCVAFEWSFWNVPL